VDENSNFPSLLSVSDLMSLGNDYWERDLCVEALGCFVAAGLQKGWNAWTDIMLILQCSTLEENRPLSHSLLQFFHDRYVDALKDAEAAGDHDAIYELSGVYEYGNQYIEPNESLALELLERLGNLNYVKAQFKLFEIYLFDSSCLVEQDKTAAMVWLHKAAENGHAEAKQWLVTLEKYEKAGIEYP